MHSSVPTIPGVSNSSLRFRVIAMLLVCAALVLLVNIGYSYVSQKKLLYQELGQTADVVADRLAFTMSQPLWDFNKQSLEQLILQELKSPSVLSVLVTATDKELLSLGYRKTRAEPEGIEPFSDHLAEPSGALHCKRQIVHAGQTIGTVHVALADYHHRIQLKQLITGQILQAILILASISLLTYLGLSLLILKPLKELQKTAVSFARGDLDARLAVESNDEIGALGSTFNRMAVQIADKIRALELSEDALRESEEFRKRVFEGSRIPIVVMDAATMQFVDCNSAAAGILHNSTVAETLGKTQLDFSPDHQPDGALSSQKAEMLVAETLQSGMTVFEWRHQRPDGVQWDAEVHLMSFQAGGRQFLQFTLQDITESKKTAALMVQTEKMMMVGGLAAGMAHEINNPLGIITQTAQNIQRRLDAQLPANQAVAEQCGINLVQLQQYLEARQIFDFLKTIREATERAARIIANTLKFSRKSESFVEYADLSELIEQVLELAANDYDLKKNYDFKRVTVRREIPDALPKVPVSVLEIEQVLLNLLKNAAQAMYEAATPDPQVTVRASVQGEYAVLEIADNGPGMPPEVQKRIFEPFYTTKEVGKGTGLGLSVSYAIVTTNHGGRLEVHSRPGNGTCFSLWLPLQRAVRHQSGVSA